MAQQIEELVQPILHWAPTIAIAFPERELAAAADIRVPA